MNLGIICNIQNNIPECVIVHDYNREYIGYSTYNVNFSKLLDVILDNKIYSKNILNNIIHYNECNKNNPFYLNIINDYLPYPYKITWIKNINGNMEEILEESYNILDLKNNDDSKN